MAKLPVEKPGKGANPDHLKKWSYKPPGYPRRGESIPVAFFYIFPKKSLVAALKATQDMAFLE